MELRSAPITTGVASPNLTANAIAERTATKACARERPEARRRKDKEIGGRPLHALHSEGYGQIGGRREGWRTAAPLIDGRVATYQYVAQRVANPSAPAQLVPTAPADGDAQGKITLNGADKSV
eukprot:3848409-Pleurochrysis_carterae.AAC.4